MHKASCELSCARLKLQPAREHHIQKINEVAEPLVQLDEAAGKVDEKAAQAEQKISAAQQGSSQRA